MRDLTAARGIHTYPPLYTEEGADPATASRAPVPIGELWTSSLDAREQLGIED